MHLVREGRLGPRVVLFPERGTMVYFGKTGGFAESPLHEAAAEVIGGSSGTSNLVKRQGSVMRLLHRSE